MKHQILNRLVIAMFLLGGASSFAAKRTLDCKGTLDTARSTAPDVYLAQDRTYYGIDNVRVHVSSVSTSNLETDTPAEVRITGQTDRVLNDHPEQNLLRENATSLSNRFHYTTVRSAPYFTKVSNTYFLAVSPDGRGTLEIDMTSGSLRHYRFDVVCK